MWPQGFNAVSQNAWSHSEAAQQATNAAFEHRAPSAHQKAASIHLAAAAAHKQAAQALGDQMRGTPAAKMLEQHNASSQQHLSDAAFHTEESQRQPMPNPRLTYGQPRVKLTYGPGAPPTKD